MTMRGFNQTDVNSYTIVIVLHQLKREVFNAMKFSKSIDPNMYFDHIVEIKIVEIEIASEAFSRNVFENDTDEDDDDSDDADEDEAEDEDRDEDIYERVCCQDMHSFDP
ncbi:hypothetical protein HHI36_013394 [Cryptolaemus montrouzieri]|uniref:Uncharacterized protein n=1 Tax=Cryptolaemus montrouzieri TaxID=559131 RepID=A0ABD2NHG4_9CUCU